jgi:hypothetical protein
MFRKLRRLLVVPGFQLLGGPVESSIEVTEVAGVGPAGIEIIANARAADFVAADRFEDAVGGVGHVAVVAFAAG